ncbi:hypothetical protein IWQ60_008483 [Tieghemiomyces parasiticus]|uniref:Uncharacterized protein n=1 Tax=Tieghemiomyces parasiticus TaxID=78921 RepID=A0A9W7ZZY8_9FUNG|nr:hypothetical protein IWQ60_008483 [Tieghemiomyces parasiticus]
MKFTSQFIVALLALSYVAARPTISDGESSSTCKDTALPSTSAGEGVLTGEALDTLVQEMAANCPVEHNQSTTLTEVDGEHPTRYCGLTSEQWNVAISTSLRCMQVYFLMHNVSSQLCKNDYALACRVNEKMYPWLEPLVQKLFNLQTE